jgi:hypothetical protein
VLLLVLFVEMGAAGAAEGGRDPSKKRAKNSSSHAKNACLSSAERFAQSIFSTSSVVVVPLGVGEARARPTKLLLWFEEEEEEDFRGGGGGGGFALPVVVLLDVWAANFSRAVPYDLTLAVLT